MGWWRPTEAERWFLTRELYDSLFLTCPVREPVEFIFFFYAMKRSPHPAGRALRTQRKFVALAWSRVTPHPPALRVTRQHILPVRYSQQCQMFSIIECGCQRPTSKPKIKSNRSLILQLGLVIERYVESDTWTQMVKKRQFLTFLPVRNSRTDHRHPDLVVFLDIGKCTKKKCHISINNSPRAAQS